MDKSLVRISTPTHRSESGFLSQGSESSHKIFSIRLVINNRPLFDPSNHHMVQSPWTIESCLSRHTLLPQIPSPFSDFVRLVNSVPSACFSLPSGAQMSNGMRSAIVSIAEIVWSIFP